MRERWRVRVIERRRNTIKTQFVCVCVRERGEEREEWGKEN